MISKNLIDDNTFTEEYLETTIPQLLYLKESKLSGMGLFAKEFLPQNTIFKSNVLGQINTNGRFRDYYWGTGTLMDGIGYFCNGSCKAFNKYDVDTKIGPYIVKRINIVRNRNIDGTYSFITTSNIEKDEELILEYSSSYFITRLKNLGIELQ